MSFAATDELLMLGVGAARDGEPERARYYLEWVLRDEPSEEQEVAARYWLSTLAANVVARRQLLEEVLALAPLHPEARRDLALIDGRLQADEVIDPNGQLDPARPVLVADREGTARQRCPQCGGALRFGVEQATARCQFCGYQDAGSGREAVDEEDWFAAAYAARGHRWVIPQEQLFSCERCGATHTALPGQVSLSCPFCDSPQIVRPAAALDLIAPTGVVRFAVDEAAARRLLHAWLEEHRLLGQVNGGNLRAIYLPCWTFDLEGELAWQGYRTEHNQRVLVHGREHQSFDDVLALATRSLPDGLLQQLAFDTLQPLPYAAELLAGWPAELSTVPLTDASLLARERALDSFRQDIIVRSPEEVFGLVVTNVGLSVTSYKLLLVPVWVAHYRLADREQRVVVNGQSGRVHGTMPRGAFGRMLAWLSGDAS